MTIRRPEGRSSLEITDQTIIGELATQDLPSPPPLKREIEMNEKVNVNCGLCGKAMGLGDGRAKHFHMGCCEADMAKRREEWEAEKEGEVVPSVRCPQYMEPKHKCRVKNGK